MQWTYPYVASKKALHYQEGKATVMDEAPMINKLALEALDCTLRDLTGKSQPMGGMYMLLRMYMGTSDRPYQPFQIYSQTTET